jgi:diguanylate cyclase (GGDEF)-like protein/PAS domain S-box-containing protein
MKQFNFSYSDIAEELGIDEIEIARRKAFLEFSDTDLTILKSIHPLLVQYQAQFVDCFYDHIFAFRENQELLRRQNISITQLKHTQSAYFQSLSAGEYDLDYFHNRLKIGLTHERIGLDVKWLIGGYRKYLSELPAQLRELLNNDQDQLSNLFNALTKVITLDIGLIMDAYVFAKQKTISELELRQNNLIQGIDGFIWEFDVLQHRYRYVSKKAEAMLGYPQHQWLENPGFQQQIVFLENRQECLDTYKKAIVEGHNFEIEYRVHSADGRTVWIAERVNPEKNAAGQVILLRGLMLDIGERKRQEEQLSYLANYDELTGLPNRSLFRSHLKLALAEAKRYGKKMGVLFLDLDGFKDINDSLGHIAGDQLLKTISMRLTDEVLRGTDFVARLGGDEFCIVLENKQGDFHPELLAERCLEVLGEPTLIGTSNIYPRVSIGIAVFPDDSDNAEALLRAADNSMYAAKAAGKHQFAFYNPEMTSLAEQRLSLENDLRNAVTQQLFILQYQPQVSLLSGNLISVEALIRWQDPVRGLVPPDEFILVAEKIGLISAMGEWVIKTACQQFMEWRNSGVMLEHVAVNISSSHFRSKTFTDTISNILLEIGMQPEHLQLEVTESVIQTNQECLETFRKIKALGVKISIDDFGTGYSCLSSLTHLPVDCLKIDKSFINKVLSNTNDAAIVATILAMAKVLNFSVVAEGVETLEQLQFLYGIGCEIIQGYFFSKPVCAEQITELSAKNFLPKILVSSIP